MKILNALQAKKIRYGAGKHFDFHTKPGEFLHIDSYDELPELLRSNAEGYAGAVFVRFDEELPASVPTDSPEHTWAWALLVGKNYEEFPGAVVIWSSDAIEKSWKASRPGRMISHDEFNIRRSG